MASIVLLRHGESQWNLENRFTGWTDIELSEKGRAEAHRAGQLLREGGYAFDMAFTSRLRRAIHTLWITLEELDQDWIPEQKSWRLNERHYGALQGLNKAETAQIHGEEQVQIWRRSYDIQPPALETDDPRFPGSDPRYRDVPRPYLPLTESLKDTVARFLPFWEVAIVPEIILGKRIIIAAHGNTIRALIKHLDNVSDDAIVNLNIPTGIPLVYELNDDLQPTAHYYLGQQGELQTKAEQTVSEGRGEE